MLYRKLGCTGYDASLIGFGTWQLGEQRWSLPSNTDSIRLLQESRELGVNIYDVAVVYGQYQDQLGYLQSRAQERLGQAFARQRDKVIYCLKLGQFDEYSHRHDYEPKRIIEQFQHSLRRLKTDYIDICLIHAPSIYEVKSQKAITVLKTLQALGQVRMIGYSFEAEPEHALLAMTQSIDVIMLQYNLLDQECATVIDEARIRGIGILCGGGFKRGYLTGRYLSLDDLPMDDDYWQWNIKLNKEKVEQIISQVNILLAECGSPENLRKAALAYILQRSSIGSCIIGHRTIDEVSENIHFIEQLSEEVEPLIPPILEIGQAIESNYLI